MLEGPSWLRGIIKPDKGNAIAFIDWSAEEIGIAAAMSGDANLWGAYISGDPYMQFAIDMGAAPAGASKFTHPSVRSEFKSIMLSIQFGIGEHALATDLNCSPICARDILERHRELYGDYWRWSDGVVITALRNRALSTVFGWRVQVGRAT